MPRFRKKPVVIEAVQWMGGEESTKEMISFIDEDDFTISDGKLCINTLEGYLGADIKDWIIKGIKGEFYPIKDEIFKESYDEA